jgi:two-component system chemotaxis sensor kinase CheA
VSAAQDHDAAYIAEALPAFISEAQEQIASIEQLLLQLENDPADRELLDALFRCAHTVKGSAGIFGLDAVVAFTHHVETLLDRLREGELGLTPAISTLLLRCNDQIRRLVDAASGAGDEPQAAAERASLVTELAALAAGAAPAAAWARASEGKPAQGAPERWRVHVRFGSDTFRNGMDPLAILHYLHELGEVESIDCDTAAVPALDALDAETCHGAWTLTLQTARGQQAVEEAFCFVRDDVQLAITRVEPAAPAAETAPGTTAPKAREGGADGTRYIRVQADRLDAVINLLGELVIASAGATLMARQARQGVLVEANEQIGRLVEDIRNGTLQLRMVPIGETFSRFRRVVRDTAAELGKDVQLEIEGGDTELDKSVVERIADPLMHLVRNALDHGLETPADRLAAGKPAQGRLTLAARHESGSIVIRIDDDGRGIQRQRVLERAWDRGLVERGLVPSDEQILQLIFAPGFSTAEKVTKLSGRGVGMDVVRSNIEALRGTVAIDSSEGRGSAIEIRLPLTLAIIDGFLVGVGASKFIFPLDTVVEVIENRAVHTALDARGRGVVELRGQALPVVGLRALYALEGPVPARCSVVVIQAGAQRCGVIVDNLLGQHQTVIKPLGRMFRSLRGISGSTILGNGEVALIVDVASLGHLAAETTLPALRKPHGTLHSLPTP